MKRFLVFALLAGALVGPAARAQAPLANIPDSLDRFGLKILKQALHDTGLDATLRGKGPYTLFAPSNGAFAMVPKPKRTALLADKKTLKAVLRNHIVLGKLTIGDLAKRKNNSPLKTLGGTVIVRTKGIVLVNGSRPVQSDLAVTNGVVHVMDRVLFPTK